MEKSRKTLRLALPKGRLARQVLEKLSASGKYEVESPAKDDRRLVFEDAKNALAYFFVKPSDVAKYVERGVADAGVVGKDIILEQSPDVYELADLGIGKCKMCIAAINGYEEDRERTLRVATSFVNVTKNWFDERNREIEVIKLNGSIELAPLLGISDVIVDIVESGKTLKENDMSPIQEMFDISARLIANKVSYKFKQSQILSLMKDLEESR